MIRLPVMLPQIGKKSLCRHSGEGRNPGAVGEFTQRPMELRAGTRCLTDTAVT